MSLEKQSLDYVSCCWVWGVPLERIMLYFGIDHYCYGWSHRYKNATVVTTIWFISHLRYLWGFSVECVSMSVRFLFCISSSYTLCCQFLWTVHFWLLLRYFRRLFAWRILRLWCIQENVKPPIISNGLVEVAVYGCEIYPSTIFSYSVYKPVLVMKIAIILFTNL